MRAARAWPAHAACQVANRGREGGKLKIGRGITHRSRRQKSARGFGGLHARGAEAWGNPIFGLLGREGEPPTLPANRVCRDAFDVIPECGVGQTRRMNGKFDSSNRQSTKTRQLLANGGNRSGTRKRSPIGSISTIDNRSDLANPGGMSLVRHNL